MLLRWVFAAFYVFWKTVSVCFVCVCVCLFVLLRVFGWAPFQQFAVLFLSSKKHMAVCPPPLAQLSLGVFFFLMHDKCFFLQLEYEKHRNTTSVS